MKLTIYSVQIAFLCLFCIVGPAESASSLKRLAYNKAMAVEVFAETDRNGQWCNSKINLIFQTSSTEFFGTNNHQNMVSQLAQVISRGCPSVDLFSVYGNNANDQKTVYTAEASKSESWILKNAWIIDLYKLSDNPSKPNFAKVSARLTTQQEKASDSQTNSISSTPTQFSSKYDILGVTLDSSIDEAISLFTERFKGLLTEQITKTIETEYYKTPPLLIGWRAKRNDNAYYDAIEANRGDISSLASQFDTRFELIANQSNLKQITAVHLNRYLDQAPLANDFQEKLIKKYGKPHAELSEFKSRYFLWAEKDLPAIITEGEDSQKRTFFERLSGLLSSFQSRSFYLEDLNNRDALITSMGKSMMCSYEIVENKGIQSVHSYHCYLLDGDRINNSQKMILETIKQRNKANKTEAYEKKKNVQIDL